MADKLASDDGTVLVKSGTNLLPLPRITLEDTDVSLILLSLEGHDFRGPRTGFNCNLFGLYLSGGWGGGDRASSSDARKALEAPPRSSAHPRISEFSERSGFKPKEKNG